jgi:hypothetical protein
MKEGVARPVEPIVTLLYLAWPILKVASISVSPYKSKSQFRPSVLFCLKLSDSHHLHILVESTIKVASEAKTIKHQHEFITTQGHTSTVHWQ